jgi:hypothetical protein
MALFLKQWTFPLARRFSCSLASARLYPNSIATLYLELLEKEGKHRIIDITELSADSYSSPAYHDAPIP